jgi:hypothetical protein
MSYHFSLVILCASLALSSSVAFGSPSANLDADAEGRPTTPATVLHDHTTSVPPKDVGSAEERSVRVETATTDATSETSEAGRADTEDVLVSTWWRRLLSSWWQEGLEPDVYGGVTFGQSLYGFALTTSPDYDDGRETRGDNFRALQTFTVSSRYLAKVGDTRFFVGFGVSAAYHSMGDSSTTDYTNPYCPNGIEGDYQETQTGGFEYCENLFGVQTRAEQFLHVPAELIFAYTYRPIRRLMLNVSFGPSVHYFAYRYELAESGTSLHEYDFGADQDLIFWRENYTHSAVLNPRRVVPGFFVGSSVDVIFGKLPRIGGDWGLTLDYKGTVARADYKNSEEAYLATARDLDTGEVYDRFTGYGGFWAEVSQDSMRFAMSNHSLSVGLSYHY